MEGVGQEKLPDGAAVVPAGLNNAEIQAWIDSAKDLIKMKSERVIEGDLIAGFNQKFQTLHLHTRLGEFAALLIWLWQLLQMPLPRQ